MQKGRKAEVLDRYYEGIGRENCERIESVALDGARTYISSTSQYAVKALVVYDKFHVIQKLNMAVDTVRRQELRKARVARAGGFSRDDELPSAVYSIEE